MFSSVIAIIRQGVCIRALLLFCLLFPGSAEAVFPEEVPDRADIQEGLSFQLREGLLSVDIREVPLNKVLRAILEKRGIKILLSDPAQEEISVKFTEMPVDKGLERILEGRDYLFLYGGKDYGLRTVMVCSRKDEMRVQGGQARREAPVAGDHRDAEREFQQLAYRALWATDPAARLEAVEDLRFEENEERAAEILTQVLEWEEGRDIREAALEAMARFDKEGGALLKAAMISLKDPEQEIRLQAVDLLSNLEAWGELRQVAQSHDDPEVRKIAADALDDA